MIPRCGYCHDRLPAADWAAFDNTKGEGSCSRCGSVLGADLSRLWGIGFLGMLVFMAGAALTSVTSLGIAIPIMAAGAITAGFGVWRGTHLYVIQPGCGFCPGCGYDLKGAVRGGGFYTCPECGTKTGKPAHD